MEFLQLKKIISENIATSTLSLPFVKLDMESVTQLGQLHLQGGSLVIEKIVIEEKSVEEQVVISGTGANLPFTGMSIVAVFAVVDKKAAVIVSAQGNSDWTFGKSFPLLEGSPVSALQFLSPTLILSSQSILDKGIESPGLYFEGKLKATSLEGLQTLVGDDGQMLKGAIGIENGVPKMILSGPKRSGYNFGLGAFEFSFEAHTLAVSSSKKKQAQKNYEAGARKIKVKTNTWVSDDSYQGKTFIRFVAKGQGLTLTADVFNLEPTLQLKVEPTGVKATFEQLKSLVNNVDFSTKLPSGFKPAAQMGLAYLVLQIDLTVERPLIAVAFVLETEGKWLLIQNPSTKQAIIEVANPKLHCRVDDPFGDKQASLGISGQLKVGEEGILEWGASYPDFVVRMNRKQGTILKLKEVATYLLGNSTGFFDLTVAYCDLLIEPGKSYSAGIELVESWPLPLVNKPKPREVEVIGLEDAQIHLQYDQIKNTVAKQVGGLLEVGNGIFDVSAALTEAGLLKFTGGPFLIPDSVEVLSSPEIAKQSSSIKDFISCFAPEFPPSLLLPTLPIPTLELAVNYLSKAYEAAGLFKGSLKTKFKVVPVEFKAQIGQNGRFISILFATAKTLTSFEIQHPFTNWNIKPGAKGTAVSPYDFGVAVKKYFPEASLDEQNLLEEIAFALAKQPDITFGWQLRQQEKTIKRQEAIATAKRHTAQLIAFTIDELVTQFGLELLILTNEQNKTFSQFFLKQTMDKMCKGGTLSESHKKQEHLAFEIFSSVLSFGKIRSKKSIKKGSVSLDKGRWFLFQEVFSKLFMPIETSKWLLLILLIMNNKIPDKAVIRSFQVAIITLIQQTRPPKIIKVRTKKRQLPEDSIFILFKDK